MQTKRAKRISSKVRTHPIDGKRTEVAKQRHHQCKTDHSPVRGSTHDFLKAVFKPKSFFEVETSPYNRDNYEYLYKSVERYAELSSKSLTITPENKSLSLLAKQLALLLPKSQEYRLIKKDGILHFQIIDVRDYYTFYHLPCRIIDDSEGEFKEILIQFFRLLQKQFDLYSFITSEFLELYCDIEKYDKFDFSTVKDDEDNEDDDMGWERLLYRYKSGDISELFELIGPDKACSIREFKKLLKKFDPYTEREKKMIEVISEGLLFLKKGKSIGSMSYYPEVDLEECYPIEIINILRVIYDDLVEDNYENYLSETGNEYGSEFFSAGNMIISPAITKIFQPDMYVVNFINWIKKLTDVLYYI